MLGRSGVTIGAATVVGLNLDRGMELFSFPGSIAGSKTKHDIEFHHSIRNISKFKQKVGNAVSKN